MFQFMFQYVKSDELSVFGLESVKLTDKMS